MMGWMLIFTSAFFCFLKTTTSPTTCSRVANTRRISSDRPIEDLWWTVECYAYHCSWVIPTSARKPKTGGVPLLFLNDPKGAWITGNPHIAWRFINQSSCTCEHVEIKWSGVSAGLKSGILWSWAEHPITSRPWISALIKKIEWMALELHC
jgi:hypothetical protein